MPVCTGNDDVAVGADRIGERCLTSAGLTMCIFIVGADLWGRLCRRDDPAQAGIDGNFRGVCTAA